jgi:hypothetical protein
LILTAKEKKTAWLRQWPWPGPLMWQRPQVHVQKWCESDLSLTCRSTDILSLSTRRWQSTQSTTGPQIRLPPTLQKLLLCIVLSSFVGQSQ